MTVDYEDRGDTLRHDSRSGFLDGAYETLRTTNGDASAHR